MNILKKYFEKDFFQFFDILSKVEMKFGKLSIQECVGDQLNLFIFDYGGVFDVIEGYVFLRFCNKVVLFVELKMKIEVLKDGNLSGEVYDFLCFFL